MVKTTEQKRRGEERRRPSSFLHSISIMNRGNRVIDDVVGIEQKCRSIRRRRVKFLAFLLLIRLPTALNWIPHPSSIWWILITNWWSNGACFALNSTIEWMVHSDEYRIWWKEDSENAELVGECPRRLREGSSYPESLLETPVKEGKHSIVHECYHPPCCPSDLGVLESRNSVISELVC